MCLWLMLNIAIPRLLLLMQGMGRRVGWLSAVIPWLVELGLVGRVIRLKVSVVVRLLVSVAVLGSVEAGLVLRPDHGSKTRRILRMWWLV